MTISEDKEKQLDSIIEKIDKITEEHKRILKEIKNSKILAKKE